MLGAGHNGLVLQAYPCRAGLREVAPERLARAEGPLVTEPDPQVPGSRHNTHAGFLRGISAMAWFGDLELARHRAAHVPPSGCRRWAGRETIAKVKACATGYARYAPRAADQLDDLAGGVQARLGREMTEAASASMVAPWPD